jgi:hypothetical protein
MLFYIRQNLRVLGPFPPSELQDMLYKGTLSAETPIREIHDAEWTPLAASWIRRGLTPPIDQLPAIPPAASETPPGSSTTP